MRCKRAERWFSKVRDGELSRRQRRRFAGHLRSCPACHEEYRQFWRSQRLLRRADPAQGSELPPGLTDAVIERLRREVAPAAARSWHGGVDARVALGMAATLALLLWGDRVHVLDELPDVESGDSVWVGERP